VFIDGITTQAQGVGIWNGYIDSPLLTASLQLNAWFTSAAFQIWTQLNSQIDSRPTIFISGYSAGGAIAVALALSIRLNWPNTRIVIIAFGAPRIITGTTLERNPLTMPNLQFAHFMNSDDPVSLIPPNPTFFRRVVAGLSVGASLRLSQHREYPNGTNVTQTFTFRPGNSPVDLPTPAENAIAGWMLAQADGLQTPHSIDTYVARLNAAVPNPTSQPILAPREQGVPQAWPIKPQGARQLINEAVQTAFADSTRQNAVPVNIPAPQLFQKVRQGNLWSVTFRGVTVALAPRKKRAAALARIGNAFLRRLQNEAVVNVDDLGQEFLGYLDDASNPESGFQPQMNTSL
jgi:hypothetical protein